MIRVPSFLEIKKASFFFQIYVFMILNSDSIEIHPGHYYIAIAAIGHVA